MTRPRTKFSELTPLFITRINELFFGNLKAAYINLKVAELVETSVSLHIFYAILRGEDCTEAQTLAIEQCLIRYAKEVNLHPAIIHELEASATIKKENSK